MQELTPEQRQAIVDQLIAANAGAEAWAIEATRLISEGLASVMERALDALQSLAREFARVGLIALPEHAYRQTSRGRVPRLDPWTRKRQTELRRLSGRR